MRRVPYVPERDLDDYLTVVEQRLADDERDLPDPPELSPGEQRVLQLASCGVPPTEIHKALRVSYETVKTQLASARAKLHAKNTGHACCKALRRGMIQ